MDKILKLQSKIGKLSKTEENPFFNSKYFDINGLLEQLQPLLEEFELTVIQPLTTIDGRPALRTVLKDGDTVISDEAIIMPDADNPQKMGSCITYYRRYALQSLFCLQAEDDDANLGSGKKAKKKSKKTLEEEVPF
jgi:hypothetical protein